MAFFNCGNWYQIRGIILFFFLSFVYTLFLSFNLLTSFSALAVYMAIAKSCYCSGNCLIAYLYKFGLTTETKGKINRVLNFYTPNV